MPRFNPWWSGREDPHLKRWRQQNVRWIPRWIDRLSLKPFSLNFILGPRLVGKTTGIKLLIDRLLREVDSRKILYVSCEVFPEYTMLSKILLKYLEAMERRREPIYIFLDEVTALKDWWKAVKPLIDAGVLEDTVVTVTGSSTLKVRGDVELFPGRRGEGVVVEAMPLTFPEYVSVHGLHEPELYPGKVEELFARYLSTGGFPPSINEHPYSEILSAYIGEIVRFGRSLEVAKEVLSALISASPSPMSYRSLAAKTSGYSYKVVQNYIEFFRDLYLVGVAYLKQGGKILYRREKKFFFRDPLLLHLFSDWTGTPSLESALYEQVVQEHLYRKYNEIYYYKNAYEIDVIADGLRIEVKAGKPHRRYPRRVQVVDKDQLPFFLLKIGEYSSGSNLP